MAVMIDGIARRTIRWPPKIIQPFADLNHPNQRPESLVDLRADVSKQFGLGGELACELSGARSRADSPISCTPYGTRAARTSAAVTVPRFPPKYSMT
jgi:hypothetical protein